MIINIKNNSSNIDTTMNWKWAQHFLARAKHKNFRDDNLDLLRMLVLLRSHKFFDLFSYTTFPYRCCCCCCATLTRSVIDITFKQIYTQLVRGDEERKSFIYLFPRRLRIQSFIHFRLKTLFSVFSSLLNKIQIQSRRPGWIQRDSRLQFNVGKCELIRPRYVTDFAIFQGVVSSSSGFYRATF